LALACLVFGLDGVITTGTNTRNVIVSSYGMVTPVAGILACAAAAAGLAGLLVRARWATPVLAVGAAAMAVIFVRLGQENIWLQLQFALSAVMMATAAALSWRGARSGWGNVRALA
jgi:hypothetical protein